MTDQARPWWASDGPVDGGPAPDEDPLERHRQARSGSGEESEALHDPDICGVCPICAGLRVVAETRPDLATHLAEAARHLAAVLRDLLEHPPAPPGRGPRGDGDDDRGTGGLHRIDLDDPSDAP